MADDTKTCPYCAETIKAAAVVCRFCGRELVETRDEPPERARGGIGWGFIGVLGIAVLAIALFGIAREAPAASTDWGTPSEAYLITQRFVKDRLKTPATAQFPPYSRELVQDFTAGRYKVTAYVDSQNSFGAMIRTDFTAIVETDDGKNWRLESLDMSP